MTQTINVLMKSGGKDSTATWLLAREMGIDPLVVFNDTGNEHPLTYQYLDYLEQKLGPIKRIKADFNKQIAHKREYIIQHWPRKLTEDVPGKWVADSDDIEPETMPPPPKNTFLSIRKDGWVWKTEILGYSEAAAAKIIEVALTVLYPTGNPFLDLCIWKGRFPSTKARFCTVELKVRPAHDQIYFPLLDEGYKVISWQGIRADESRDRALMPEREGTPEGYEIYRPLINWTAKDVFAMHDKYGIEPNPLYKLGMGRVGCMPCINAGKQELFEIALRFPEVIKRISEWEEIVKKASKRQGSTFFPTANGRGDGILEMVEWSKTAYGGQQYDMFKIAEWESEEVPMCSSQYGLCE